MSDLLTPPAVDAVAVGEAAAAALYALPGLQVDPVPDGVGPRPDEPRAVALDCENGTRVVLLASKATARQLQVGPPPADEFLDACHEPLAAAAAAAGLTPVAEAAEVDLGAAAAPTGWLAIASRLVDASGAHAATIAVVVPANAAPSGTDTAPVHEFAPLPDGQGELGHTGLELLHDVALGVTAELGRTRMLVKEVLSLAPGSVIELDRAAGSPVDVLVNGTLIARGEVVVIDEEFGIRITEVIGYVEGTR
jgi:flagellar motor switch protein FliN/FliY